jgi:hypothetical protein
MKEFIIFSFILLCTTVILATALIGYLRFNCKTSWASINDGKWFYISAAMVISMIPTVITLPLIVSSAYVVEAYEIPIYSLSSSSNIAGTFTLGSGRIDSKATYVTYIGRDDGLTRYEFNANGIVLTMRDNVQPKLIMHQNIIRSGVIFNVLHAFIDEPGFVVRSQTGPAVYPVKLIVPTKTIISKFEVK